MIGAVVIALATTLGSLTTDIGQMYVCNAVAGIGAVAVVSPGAIIISQYFKKRYFLANGITILGLNTGQMVFPPLIRLLISAYGWRGAMFITGAFQFNAVAACALFRPFKTDFDIDKVQSPSRAGSVESHPLRDVVESEKEDNMSENALQEQDGGTRQKCWRFLEIFTNLQAVMILMTSCLQCVGLVMNITHLPARAREAGWSNTQGAMLVLAFGISSALTRSLHGWFVGRAYVDSFILQLTVLLCTTLTTFLNPVSDSYVFLVCYSVALGTFLGVSVPLLMANVKTVVSTPQVPTALSLMWATFYLGGIGSIVAGKIYDATGAYLVPFLAAGTLFLTAFLLFAVVTVRKNRQNAGLQRL
ncbi:monocarboxylate transporter 12-like isoform X2 [Acanthaster planci]|nr:monocarboxylate transporter 12-like isoform X2 [Acanthaster planci]XP_022081639.1 monocarboxylate transporter 12-like isoform X2 [Acanthaster planci]XP_022081640.1 monocarboxylate transporter 12-like isoform X2 [Acanthaster planci]XP_022081641.1 monocarboxylate transporter 12-like isoform X2 [Acanthaster planci]